MTSDKSPRRRLGSSLIALGLFLGLLVPGLIRANFTLTRTGDHIVTVITLAGLLAYCCGLSLIARSKGRSVFWGLTGLCCWVGGVAIAFLKPKSPTLPHA